MISVLSVSAGRGGMLQTDQFRSWIFTSMCTASSCHTDEQTHVGILLSLAGGTCADERACGGQARQVLVGVLGFMMYKLALVSVTVLPPMSHSVQEVQRRA